MSIPSHARPDDYTVGWICALPVEFAAARGMLDEIHEEFYRHGNGTNIYKLGRMGPHNVVIACMPSSQTGTNSAAAVATQMMSTFQSIEFGLMVGVGGGVPSTQDIRLGDVVVSRPGPSHGGVVQYDLGKNTESGFLRTGFLNTPPILLLNALARIEAEWDREKARFMENISKLDRWPIFSRKTTGTDLLFRANYTHTSNNTCEYCDQTKVINRKPRGQEIMVHYGSIASGNQLMRDAMQRDKVSTELGGVLCFEMEAAGLMNTFSCLVIRGICDYADSHKNKAWQAYAAGTAAAYAKVVLSVIPPAGMSRLKVVHLDFAKSYDHALNSRNIGETVRSYEQDLGKYSHNLKDPSRKMKEKQLLRRLRSSPFRARKERNPDRIQGTCEWFTDHILFQEWQCSDTSRILWVSADPGCGKSVLAKYLADDVLVTNDSRTTCYFFFKDDFEDQRTVVNALSCILHQLFMHRRILLSEAILEQFEIGGENFTSSFDELWGILISVAEDNNAGEIVCLLDAIDECEERGRTQLVKAICKLYGTRRNFKLKFLLTSRPYGEIRRGFQPLEIPELPIIHLSGEDEVEMKKISREIDIFIKARVNEISAKLRLKCDEQDLLMQKLMLVPNRTYLWVHLTLNLVESDIDIDKARIIDAITHLPSTVDEAYENILARSRNSEEAKKMLQMVVAATRPLTLREMSLALALRDGHNSYEDLDLKTEERFRENVRDICGLFITVIDSKLYLLHQTAKEFLVQSEVASPRISNGGNLKWKYSLCLQESHLLLTETCIRHLLFTNFESNPLTEDQTLSEYVNSHVFLDYSAKNWATHYRHSNSEGRTMTRTLLRICNANSNQCLTWFRVYWTSTHREFPKDFTTLMIASYLGLNPVVKALLATNRIILNARDHTYGRSALSWAAENGFHYIVDLLIKRTSSRLKGIVKRALIKGAQVESVDRYGRTPLSYAAWNGHVAVVKLLLKAGAQTDWADDIGGTPLSYAIFSGHKEVVKLLSNEATQVQFEASMSQNLLHSAAIRGHADFVKLLLETGKVDPDQKDHDHRTPLWLATLGGHVAIVKLLLETGKVDPDRKDNGRLTPLWLATLGGHVAIVKLLLETGKVDPDQKDHDHRTPLYSATVGSHVAIVKLLLDTGKVDLEFRDIDGRTALSRAAGIGYEAIVKHLLETGRVDPDSKDSRGFTPLWYAIARHHEAIAKLLLEKGRANPDLGDEHSRTPFWWAAKAGNLSITRLLLETGRIYPDGRDTAFRWTPLSLAAQIGNEAIVTLLLKTDKVDPDSKDIYLRTPLWFAARIGNEVIAKLLLKTGRVDPDSKDKFLQTPLSLAAEAGHADIIRLLLETDKVCIDAMNSSGWTPLMLAAKSGGATLVHLMLNKGRKNPDPSSKTDRNCR